MIIDIIGVILELYGFIELLFLISTVGKVNVTWFNDIEIYEVDNEYFQNVDLAYRVKWLRLDTGQYARNIVFTPCNRTLKFELLEIDYSKKHIQKKKIKTVYNVTPMSPLGISVELNDFPKYCVRWKGDYGSIIEYYLNLNGKSDKYHIKGIEQRHTVISKIRRIFRLA